MTTLGVVVATFGSEGWYAQGFEKSCAIRESWSVPENVIHSHVYNGGLAEARNRGIESLETEYIVICDGDDMLTPGFEEAMLEAISDRPGNYLYQPSSLGVTDGVVDNEPHLIPDRDMNISNHLIIGTVFSKKYAERFDHTLPALEDWDFFAKMIYAGAKVIQVPNAIYEVHVRPHSRNKDDVAHGVAYRTIKRRGYIGFLKNYMEVD